MADPFDFREYGKFLKAEKQEAWLKLIALAIGGFSLAVIVGISAIWLYNHSWASDDATSPQVPRQSELHVVAGLGQVPNHTATGEAMTSTQASFSMCSMVKRNNCVVDGDTIWMSGRKIRIADIDAPEKSDPKCDSEYELALQATARLLELVNLGPIELQPIGSRDQDQYGRDLRILLLEGQSVGDILVSEGLARTWTGRREPWC